MQGRLHEASYYLNPGPGYPDHKDWMRLAKRVETFIGQEIEAIIEEDNRYIIKSSGNSVLIAESNTSFYLRLRLWKGSNGKERETGWVKVDYLVIGQLFRCQGLGSKIVELIIDWIHELQAFNHICLYARGEAVPFWVKCGFVQELESGRMSYNYF